MILQLGWNDSRDWKSCSCCIKRERNRSNPIYAHEDDRQCDDYRDQNASKEPHDRAHYAFALAFNLTCPPAISTENSTSWHPYCLRISSVFFCTKLENELRLPETFSPAFFLA